MGVNPILLKRGGFGVTFSEESGGIPSSYCFPPWRTIYARLPAPPLPRGSLSSGFLPFPLNWTSHAP